MTFDQRLDAAYKAWIVKGGGELTQREIADSVGVSHQYIDKIASKAMRKLRKTYR